MIEPADIAAIIRAIRGAAAADGVHFCLIGALARDLRLVGVDAITKLRQTKDVDFAVMVADLASFQRLREALLRRSAKDFTARGAVHRLRFRNTLDIDILPFGGIADQDGTITILPDVQAMTVIGFDDAINHATPMVVGGEPVLVVSIPSLVSLKLLAWHDNSLRTKDAEDLAFILESARYLDLPENDSRLWQGPDKDLVDSPEFDYELASARLVGRDTARSLTGKARLAVMAIVGQSLQPPYLLATAMKPYVKDQEFARALALLDQLNQGLKDISAP